jgi:predicted aconitase with swiveling domain
VAVTGAREIAGESLLPGTAQGRLLVLTAPLSFWGGVQPQSGRIVMAGHPQHGLEVAGRLLALPGTIGSSSSSSVMLELLREGRAPAGLLLAEVDAILLLGVAVARELGYRPIPALRLAPAALAALPDGAEARIENDRLVVLPSPVIPAKAGIQRIAPLARADDGPCRPRRSLDPRFRGDDEPERGEKNGDGR